MKTCFQIAECSFSSAKIMENQRKTSSLLDFFAEMQLIFCKDSPFFATLHPYQIWRYQTFITIAISPSSYFCKVFRHSRQNIRPTQLHPLISNSSVTTKLQDEKQLHHLGSLTDETAKNRFPAIFSHSFPTIPRTKKWYSQNFTTSISIHTHQQEMLLYFTISPNLVIFVKVIFVIFDFENEKMFYKEYI